MSRRCDCLSSVSPVVCLTSLPVRLTWWLRSMLLWSLWYLAHLLLLPRGKRTMVISSPQGFPTSRMRGKSSCQVSPCAGPCPSDNDVTTLPTCRRKGCIARHHAKLLRVGHVHLRVRVDASARVQCLDHAPASRAHLCGLHGVHHDRLQPVQDVPWLAACGALLSRCLRGQLSGFGGPCVFHCAWRVVGCNTKRASSHSACNCRTTP